MRNASNEMMNNLIGRVNAHNDRCIQTWNLYDNEDCNEECVDTMVQANISVGIEYCCWMFEYGMDEARVDMLNGMIVSKRDCDIRATTAEGKPRYLSFTWAE